LNSWVSFAANVPTVSVVVAGVVIAGVVVVTDVATAGVIIVANVTTAGVVVIVVTVAILKLSIVVSQCTRLPFFKRRLNELLLLNCLLLCCLPLNQLPLIWTYLILQHHHHPPHYHFAFICMLPRSSHILTSSV